MVLRQREREKRNFYNAVFPNLPSLSSFKSEDLHLNLGSWQSLTNVCLFKTKVATESDFFFFFGICDQCFGVGGGSSKTFEVKGEVGNHLVWFPVRNDELRGQQGKMKSPRSQNWSATVSEPGHESCLHLL